MPVPLLDVNAQNHALSDELTQAFQRVLAHGQFILGKEVLLFEEEMSELLGGSHAIGVSSGTDALLLAFMALELGPGDEVLCPSFTFFATAGTIARTGATPVFVDACPVSFNVDLNDARNKITSKTKAIVPVHLFGQSADMDGVAKLAEEFDLAVIEDAAQSLGSTYRGKKSGTMGDFGAFSFFPSKNLGGLGDSGLLITQDDKLAEKARILRVHGGQPKYYHHLVGANFRIDALQAALLRVKLQHYPAYTEKRQANAAFYTEQLSQIEGIECANLAHQNQPELQSQWLQQQPHDIKILLPTVAADSPSIWNQYTLRVIGEGKRDALREHLQESGIGAEIYYPVTMDRQPCFNYLPASSLANCDTAHRLADEVISLPIYPELSAEQRMEVVASVKSFL